MPAGHRGVARMSKMVEQLLSEHRGKTLGFSIGLLLALAILVFSLHQVLFILFCAAVGFVVGKAIDDKVDLESWISRIFGPRE